MKPPLAFFDYPDGLIADMVTVCFGRLRIMDGRMAFVRPMRLAHLRMNRKQIALHENQVPAPIIGVDAVIFDPLPRFKSTLPPMLPLLHRCRPLSPIRLVYYIPSVGKRLQSYPLGNGKRGSELALMGNRDVNADRCAFQAETFPCRVG